MTELDDHIERVEQYGFVRSQFPLSYNGHHLKILSNDAHLLEGRLLFDFTLFCDRCLVTNNISGRLPDKEEEQIEKVVNAKVGIFDEFYLNECQ